MQQLALKIDTPDQHAKALHPLGIGKVTIARKDKEKRWLQGSYSVEHLPKIARMLEGESDVFISQNRFYGRRLITQLAQLDALFTDLDYYRIKGLQQHTPDQVYGLAREYLEDENLPMPNLAIGTGRGVALIWLHQPVPRQALPRWVACQKQIYEVLKPLGADAKALDAARVLRLVGTTNGTANVQVRALNPLTTPPWEFDDLANEILPLSRAEIHSLGIERSLRKQLRLNRPPKQFNAATLWEGRLAELQSLRKHRHKHGHLPEGQRDSWLFVAGVAMSHLAPPAAMKRELYGLAREVAGWGDNECSTRMQAVIRRAWMASKGEKVTWCGKQIDARYHFKSETIVEWLDITTEEMMLLDFKHLVHANIRKERKRAKDRAYDEKRRRSSGSTTRESYEQQAQERRDQAMQLREQGLSWKAVAEEMGISTGAAKMLASRANSKKVTSPSRCMVA